MGRRKNDSMLSSSREEWMTDMFGSRSMDYFLGRGQFNSLFPGRDVPCLESDEFLNVSSRVTLINVLLTLQNADGRVGIGKISPSHGQFGPRRLSTEHSAERIREVFRHYKLPADTTTERTLNLSRPFELVIAHIASLPNGFTIHLVGGVLDGTSFNAKTEEDVRRSIRNNAENCPALLVTGKDGFCYFDKEFSELMPEINLNNNPQCAAFARKFTESTESEKQEALKLSMAKLIVSTILEKGTSGFDPTLLNWLATEIKDGKLLSSDIGLGDSVFISENGKWFIGKNI